MGLFRAAQGWGRERGEQKAPPPPRFKICHRYPTQISYTDIIESSKVILLNMIEFLMMSAKLATLSLFQIKVL